MQGGPEGEKSQTLSTNMATDSQARVSKDIPFSFQKIINLVLSINTLLSGTAIIIGRRDFPLIEEFNYFLCDQQFPVKFQ